MWEIKGLYFCLRDYNKLEKNKGNIGEYHIKKMEKIWRIWRKEQSEKQ